MNYSHKFKRGVTKEEQLTEIKQSCMDIMDSINTNITDSIKEITQSQSLIELFSCFDFDSSEAPQERIGKIDKIYEIYGEDKCKTLEDIEGATFYWNKLKINVTYPKQLSYTAPEIKNDFLKAWPKINLLSSRRNTAMKRFKMSNYKGVSPPSQLELWEKFIKENTMVHRPLVQLLKLMLSILPNTSAIERSYSYLNVICDKRRGRMLDETMSLLYMLKVLNIQPKSVDDYDDVITLMESKSAPVPKN